MQEDLDEVGVRATESLLQLEVSLKLSDIIALADFSTQDWEQIVAQGLLI